MKRAVVVALCCLLGGCSASPSTKARIEEKALAEADEIARGPLTDFLRTKAPALLPILDDNGDEKVSLAELRELDLEDPVTLTAVVLVLQQALAK